MPKESSGPGCHINMLGLLLPFQRLFIPGLILLLLWAIYRTILKKDRPVGLVLFIALIIIVDSFYNTGIYIPGMERGSIKYSEVICFFLLLHGGETKSAGGRNHLIIFLTVSYFLLFFYAALRGYTLENGINNYRRLIVPQILAVWVAYKGFDEKEDYKRFLFYFFFLVIIVGLFTFWDAFFDRWILKSEVLYNPIYWSSRKQGRFGSIFLNPNYLGSFFVLMFFPLFILTIKQKMIWKKIFCWGGLLLFIFAFIKTESRGPMLGFAGSILFFLAIPTRQFPIRRKVGALIACVLILSLFLPGFFKAATGRFSSVEENMDEDRVSRSVIWEFTIKNLIADYPLFGIGFGELQYIMTMRKYGFLNEYKYTLHNPHNSYLEIAVMAGCVTLLIFLRVCWVVIKSNIVYIRRHQDDDLSLFLLAMTSGIAGFLICLMVDMQMFTISVAPVFWVILFISRSLTFLKPSPVFVRQPDEEERPLYENRHLDISHFR